MPRRRLSATLEFGGRVLGSLRRSTSHVSTQLKRTSKVSGRVEARQRALRREIRKLGAAGEDVTNLRRRYDQLGRTLRTVERRQRGLALAQRGLRGTSAGFNRLGTVGLGAVAVGATAAGAGVFALAKKTADLGDKVAKTSAKLGLAPQTLLELRFAAERSGVGIKSFDTALQRMVRRISTARAKPNGPVAKALKQLGIEISTLSSMRPEEQLGVIADAMAGLESQADRVRLAFTLFDTEGVGLVNLLQNGEQGVNGLRQEFRKLGLELADQDFAAAETFQDRLLDAKTAVAGFGLGIGASLLPHLNRGLGQLTDTLTASGFDARAFGDRLGESIGRVFDSVGRNGPRLLELGVRMADGFAAALPVMAEVGEAVLDLVDAIGGPEVAIKGLGAQIAESLGARVFGGLVTGAKALRDLGSLAGPALKRLRPLGAFFTQLGGHLLPLAVGGAGKLGAAVATLVRKLGSGLLPLLGGLGRLLVNPWTLGVAAAGAFGVAAGRALDHAIGKALKLRGELLSTELALKAGESDTFNDRVESLGRSSVGRLFTRVSGIDLVEVAQGNRERNRLDREVAQQDGTKVAERPPPPAERPRKPGLSKELQGIEAQLRRRNRRPKATKPSEPSKTRPKPPSVPERIRAVTNHQTTTNTTKVENHQTVNIEVRATPGMDTHELSKQVAREFARQSRESRAGAMRG